VSSARGNFGGVAVVSVCISLSRPLVVQLVEEGEAGEGELPAEGREEISLSRHERGNLDWILRKEWVKGG
jgi:hypothetical protein